MRLKCGTAYDSPRANERIPTGKRNTGNIIGRIYYIRGVKPTFQEDYWRWMQNPLSTSGVYKYYSLTITIFLLSGFASWIVFEFLLYRRQTKERLHKITLEQIQKQYKKLRYQFGEQLKQSEKQETQAQITIDQLNSSVNDLNEEIRNQVERINILEDQSPRLDNPNALFIALEPDGRDLSLAELRKELGLEEVLTSGVITRIFYSDRYLYDEGGTILADLIAGNWLKPTSSVTIKVLEKRSEQPAVIRKQKLDSSLTKLKNLGIILKIEVQPSHYQDHFEHARLLAINMDGGKLYKFLFDQGMDFIKFNPANNTYSIEVPSYVTLTTTDTNNKSRLITK